MKMNNYGLLALAFLTTLSACTGKKNEEKKLIEVKSATELQVFGDAVYNVVPTKAEEKELPDILSIMGRISATEDRTTVVPARAAGRINSITVASGESVKAGDSLATIASPDFATAREEYLQSLHQSQVDSEKHDQSSDFAGIVKMSRRRLILMGLTDQDIDGLNDKGHAQVDSIAAADSQLSLVVRAPRAGAVIAKAAIVGNQVNLGDTLFTIADLSKVWFLGDVYPEDLSKIRKDQTVIVDTGTPAGKLSGKISFISPVIDATSRTVKVRALIDNPKLALRADLYTQGGVVISKQNALVVPSKAVLHEGDSDFVFRIVKQEAKEKKIVSLTIQKVKVVIGNQRDGLTGITSGLANGDQVAGEGALLLNAALQSSENAQ